ncbi:unnamed protein product [Sphagnum balticum]
MPSGIVAQHNVFGCPATPNDSIFNTNISALPVDTNSSSKITNAGNISGYYYSLVFEPSWGLSRANNSTATQTIRGYYTQGSTLIAPIASGRASLVEGGNYSGITGWLVNNQGNPDHHSMTVNYQTCGLYDIYDRFLNGTYRLANGTTTPAFQAESEGLISGLSYGVITPGGTDAAGLPLAPLTWTADEVRAGPPKHAVRFTSKGAQFAANIWKWPASNTAGGNTGVTYGSNGDSTNYIALGSRLRLKSLFTSGSGVCTDGHGTIVGTACNTGTICVSPLTSTQITYCQNMLVSLQTYGMVNADTGDSMAITPSLDFTADNDVMAAYKAIQNANIAITSFEVINEDSLFYALNTYETTPNGGTSYPQTGTAAYGGITYTPITQSYVTPANQVIVTGSTNNAVVAIQPVLIGYSLPLSGLVVAQGATIDLSANSWVNPSTLSQTITWSATGSNCGAFSGTIYTAPSAPLGSTKCGWHGVASADSAATVDIPFTLLPTSSGAVRIDSGSTVSTTDANGNTWYSETGLLSGVTLDSTPYSYWNAPNQNQYNTAVHGIGDMRYTMVVPNGNYKVHLLIGYAQCAYPCGSWPNATYVPQNWSLHEVEAQDIVTNHLLDWSYPTGYGGFKDSGIYVPATVTNNILTVSLDALVPDINCNSAQNSACTDFWTGTTWQGPNLAAPSGKYDAQFNTLAGLEVLPDTTPAFLGTDLTNQTCSVSPLTPGCSSPYTCGSQAILRNQICAGQTLTPIYPQPWYFTLSGATTWTLNDPTGKASIVTNSDGSVSLSLASGTILSGQPIQLTAQNGSYTSAPLRIFTVGSKYAINPKPLVNHYAYVRSITIHHAQVAATQTNFPVLVSVTDPTLATTANGGNVTNSHGYDIVFASNASGTPTLIPWEVETYNPATGAIVAHVLVSSLSSTTDTVLYMFYGNNSVVSAQNTGSAVWNSNFTSVYHFGSLLAGAGLSLSDSTSNANNLAPSSPSPSAATGVIGPGVNGFGSSTLLTIPTSSISPTQGTIEGWINTTQAQTNAWDVLATNDGTSPSLVWTFNHPYTSGVDFGWAGSGTIITVPFAYLVTPINTWHHIAYTYNGSAQTVYEDGVSVYSVATGASTYTPSARPIIGTYPADAGYYFQGTLDEMRFSRIALSASWIQTEYNSYFAPSTFFALGAQTAN